MRRAQTSVEYLLLTAGVILIGAIAAQAVISSGTATHTAIEEEVNEIVPKDTVPPTTELLCDGGTCYSRYNHDINIGFLCNDNLGGSGCARTVYSITQDGNPYDSGDCNQQVGECTNVATLKAPSTGTYRYTIVFHSEDLNRNVEGNKTVEIMIGEAGGLKSSCAFSWTPRWPQPGDSISITTYLIAGEHLYNPVLSLGSPLNVSFSCGDLSNTAYLKKDCTKSGIILPTSPNAYTVDVSVTGTDDFGNSGTCGSDTIIVDGISPSITDIQPDHCQWQRQDFTLRVTASDTTPTSGFGILSFTVEDGIGSEYVSPDINMSPWGGNPATGTATVTVGGGEMCEKQAVNACKITATVSDRAGNSTSSSVEYSIDYTPPTISIDTASAGWVGGSITVTFSCTDNLSGCHYVHYELTDAYNSSNNKSGNIYYSNNSGCPPKGALSDSVSLTITCPPGQTCAYSLRAYNVDYAGNTSEVKEWNSNTNGPGAYLIDNEEPDVRFGLYEINGDNDPLVLRNYPDQPGSISVTMNKSFYIEILYTDNGGSGVSRIVIRRKITGYDTSQNISFSCEDGPLTTTSVGGSAVLNGHVLGESDIGNEHRVSVIPHPGNPNWYAIHCRVDTAGNISGAFQVAAIDDVGNEADSPDCSSTTTGYCGGDTTWISDQKGPVVDTANRSLSGTSANPSCGWYSDLTVDIPTEDPILANTYNDTVYVTRVAGISIGYKTTEGITISAEFGGESLRKVNAGEFSYLLYDKTAPETGPRTDNITIRITADNTYKYFENTVEGRFEIHTADGAAKGWGNLSDTAYVYGFGIDTVDPSILSSSISRDYVCSGGTEKTSITITADVKDSESGVYSVQIYANGHEITDAKETYDCGIGSTTYSATITGSQILQAGAVTLSELESEGAVPVTLSLKVTDNAGNEVEEDIGTVTLYSPCKYDACSATATDSTCDAKDGWYTVDSTLTRTDCNPNVASCTEPPCGPKVQWDKKQYRDYSCTLEPTGDSKCTYSTGTTQWVVAGISSNPCSAEGPNSASQTEVCGCSGTSLSCTVGAGYAGASICEGYVCSLITPADGTVTYDCTNYNAKVCDGDIYGIQEKYVEITCNCSSGACSCTYDKYFCPADSPFCINGSCTNTP